MHLTGTEGYAPSIAVAHEVRFIIDEHPLFLNAERVWVAKKFDITEEETNLYIFGLFIPPTLLLAADMVGWIANSKIAESLTPPDDRLVSISILALPVFLMILSNVQWGNSHEQ